MVLDKVIALTEVIGTFITENQNTPYKIPNSPFLSDFCAGVEDVGIGSFVNVGAPFASNDFFGGG